MRLLPAALLLGLAAASSSCGGGGGGAEVPTEHFKSAIYVASQLTTHTDVAFSTRANTAGQQYTSDTRKASELGTDALTLVMDIWVPPNATRTTPMPLVVFVHGGGFQAGGKEDRADDAKGYASTGFVTASVNYRLTDNNTASAERRRTAIVEAADDVMNAIRYLKKNASSYHIDTGRIAVVGTSAGGALALIDAIEPDTLAGTSNDHPGDSARVQAVVSTGATLIDAQFDASNLLGFDGDDAPVLMFHAYSVDGTTGATWDGNAQPTCDEINRSGNSCTPVKAPTGCTTGGQSACHTVTVALDGKWWPTIQGFLAQRLSLSSL